MRKWFMIAVIAAISMRLMTSGQWHQSMMVGLEAVELQTAELELQIRSPSESSKPSRENHQEPEVAEIESCAAKNVTACGAAPAHSTAAATTASEREPPLSPPEGA